MQRGLVRNPNQPVWIATKNQLHLQMSRFSKALIRLKSKPRDFTWRELQTIMAHFGYREEKGGGSRRRFINPQNKVTISLHEPHPSPVMKQYALEIVIDHLREEGLL